MGAWCGYNDEKDKRVMGPRSLGEAGSVRALPVPDVDDRPEELTMSITSNLYTMFQRCGLNPVYDLCKAEMIGRDAIPLLEAALDKAESLTDADFLIYYAEMQVTQINNAIRIAKENPTYSDSTSNMNFLRRCLAQARDPIWGVSKESLVGIYKVMLNWACYLPEGHFHLIGM
mgnify:CR=1 FL=1